MVLVMTQCDSLSPILNHRMVKLRVNVTGHSIEKSLSEKLLGLFINNTMTWQDHLYGKKEDKGLLSNLSQHASLIRKLSNLMPPEQLRTTSNGIFLLTWYASLQQCIWSINV